MLSMMLAISLVLGIVPLLGVVWILLNGMITTVDGLFMSLILLTLSGIFMLNAYWEMRDQGMLGQETTGKKTAAARQLRLPRRKRVNVATQTAAIQAPRPPHPPASCCPRSPSGGARLSASTASVARGRRAGFATGLLAGNRLRIRHLLPFWRWLRPQHYLDYFYPGTLILIVLFTSIFAMMSLIEDRKEGFLLSVMVAPVPRSAIVLGKVLGGTTLSAIQGMIFLVFAPFAGIHLNPLQVLLVTVVVFLVSFALTALGFAIAWPMDSTQPFMASSICF